MNRTIWKFALAADRDVQHVQMPIGADILHVAEQDGKPMLWAMVNPDADRRPRRILTITTGGDCTVQRVLSTQYIGTVLLHDGQYVVHYFDGGWA